MENKLNLNLILLLLLSINLNAQPVEEYPDQSLENTPEWVTINGTSGFIWAFDMAVDKYGNTYSTGYFREAFFKDKETVINIKKQRRISGETTFIIKRDGEGKMVWLRYTIGNARPAKIWVDDIGIVTVVGTVYSDYLHFMVDEVDSHAKKMNKPVNTYGIFMCQYDVNGNLLRTKFHNEEGYVSIPNDFYIDIYGNLTIVGYYKNQDRDSRKKKDNFLLLRFNNKWNLIDKQIGNPTGTSMFNALHFDGQGNRYVTGWYRNFVDFGEIQLESKDYHQLPFVIKYNYNNEIEWINESIAKNGVSWKMVGNQYGATYIALNTSYSFSKLIKLDSDGKILWENRLDRFVLEDLVIDDRGGVYFCGRDNYATTITFGKYDDYGDIMWDNKVKGSSTNYCKAICLHQNKLFGFGWFGGSINFGGKALEWHNNAFWYAQYDLELLRK